MIAWRSRNTLTMCAIPVSPSVDGFDADEHRERDRQNQHHNKHDEVVLDPPIANYHHQIERPQEQIEVKQPKSKRYPLYLARQGPSVVKLRTVPTPWGLETPNWCLQREDDNDRRKNDNGNKAQYPEENTRLDPRLEEDAAEILTRSSQRGESDKQQRRDDPLGYKLGLNAQSKVLKGQ